MTYFLFFHLPSNNQSKKLKIVESVKNNHKKINIISNIKKDFYIKISLQLLLIKNKNLYEFSKRYPKREKEEKEESTKRKGKKIFKLMREYLLEELLTQRISNWKNGKNQNLCEFSKNIQQRKKKKLQRGKEKKIFKLMREYLLEELMIQTIMNEL